MRFEDVADCGTDWKEHGEIWIKVQPVNECSRELEEGLLESMVGA